jgi:hypothetical protein
VSSLSRKREDDVYLAEIGRITTACALFERQIDLTILKLAEGNTRRLVRIQRAPFSTKVSALVGLMAERKMPDALIEEVHRLYKDARPLVDDRNKYAHGALFMSIQDGRLQPILKHIKADQELTFQDEGLSIEELREVTEKIGALIIRFGELRHRILEVARH